MQHIKTPLINFIEKKRLESVQTLLKALHLKKKEALFSIKIAPSETSYKHVTSYYANNYLLAPSPALGFVRVTCQTVWPAIFYQQGPDLDSTLVPTWCQAPVWMREREKKRCTLLNTNTIPDGFSSPPQEKRANPTPFAHTYVWFSTQPPKKGERKKRKRYSVILFQPLEPLWEFRPISCYPH